MSFPRVTEMAQSLIRMRLPQGGSAVDATVGNGYDTLFLARCVGPEGQVDGFDIQEEAIASAQELLEEHPHVRLHKRGHETMGEVVIGPVDAVMFNLGYRPTGDKRVITVPSSTLAALASALELLSGSGILTIVVYRGHEGGKLEADALETWWRDLDPSNFRSIHYGPGAIRGEKDSPYLLAIERRR